MYKIKFDTLSPFKSRINCNMSNKLIKIINEEEELYIFGKSDIKIPINQIILGNFYKQHIFIENNYTVSIKDDILEYSNVVYLNKEPTKNFMATVKHLIVLKTGLVINEIEILTTNLKTKHFKINSATIFQKQTFFESEENTFFGFKKELIDTIKHIKIQNYKEYFLRGNIKTIKVFNLFSIQKNSGKKTFLLELSRRLCFNLEKFNEKLLDLNNFILFCTEENLKSTNFYEILEKFKKSKSNSVLFILSNDNLGNSFIDHFIQLFPPNLSDREIFLKYTFKKLNVFVEDFEILNQSLGGKTFFELKSIIRNSITNKILNESTFSHETVINSCISMNSNEICLQDLSISPNILPRLILKIEDFNLPNKIYNSGFSEIGGYINAKEALIQSVIYPFKYKSLYEKLKIKQTKGILLYGPPGCCKTKLIRALAFESNMPFFSIKGPELKKGVVGESEKSIRDLFKKARSAAPCIIFFDEIDSISSINNNTASNYELSLLTALLVELDGIDELNNVFIIGATNRKHTIDPALLRPGRLDKHILIDLPNESEREDIFKIYLCSDTSRFLNIKRFVTQTEGFSGAEIECVIKEAKQMLLNEIILKGIEKELTNEMIELTIERIRNQK